MDTLVSVYTVEKKSVGVFCGRCWNSQGRKTELPWCPTFFGIVMVIIDPSGAGHGAQMYALLALFQQIFVPFAIQKQKPSIMFCSKF